MPGVTFDVIDAFDLNVPGRFPMTSNVTEAVPPAVGPLVSTRNSWPLTGAGEMFFPLVPSRFSAPQLKPVPGSPAPALPRPGPSPGKVRFGPYEIVTSSLAGPVPAGPIGRWSQISNVCVVALLKFLTAAQSMTIQLEAAAGQRRDADRAARGRVEVGPERRDHVVRPGRVRERLRRTAWRRPPSPPPITT